MAMYYGIKRYKKELRHRTVDGLQRLRKQLRNEIPPRTVNDTVLIATWNIRDFDSNKFGHGPRLTESFHYIAEVISSFDVVALQEVNDDLKALDRVMRLLGPQWDHIVTDVTEGPGGNKERMAFVYDKRKVIFRNIAGQIVLPKSRLVLDTLQFARTPSLVAFQSGWFKFQLCTVHIYYGADSGEKLERRKAEIRRVAKFLSKRADSKDSNYILLGDFNIISPEHETMKALTDNGFKVIDSLADIPANMRRDKHYDQIAFKIREGELRPGKSGVFDFFKSVYRPADAPVYRSLINAENIDWPQDGSDEDTKRLKKYYTNTWRTFQMSDHLPMWVELKTDFSNEYLAELLGD
ncbi:endonuclease/exonuclease/phosphatase family protein [Thalassospiraceae bacterium LMO-JJ14]|nr:endonuclease/exonuclease/phosphatase family protein [Thalassospiraceae bacterium LMO-JJ14]